MKKLNKANQEKLKRRIVEDGFLAPFFIWKHDESYWIIDGTQRRKILEILKDEGYEIPLLPVIYIEAKDIAEAKVILLSIASQYGDFEKLQLEDWLSNINESIKDTLRLVSVGRDEGNIKGSESGGCKVMVRELSLKDSVTLYEELIDRGFNCKLTIAT